MNTAIRAVVVLVVTAASGSVSAAQSGANLSELLGKHRSEISAVFPGTGSTLRQWRGWETVSLVSGRQGALVAIILQPASPVSEAQAEIGVHELGVHVDPSRYFAGAREHGYSDLSGAVRTVIYDMEPDGTVRRIGLFSRLADGE